MTDDVDAVVRLLGDKGVTVGRRTAIEIITTALDDPPAGQADLVMTVSDPGGAQTNVTVSEIRAALGGST